MKKFDITYIGEFPPPHGGVTVKNKLVFQYIFQDSHAQFIDLVECKRRFWKAPEILFRIICGMVTSKVIVIGVGSTRRRKILLRMQKVLTGGVGLEKIMMIVMGGLFEDRVKQDRSLFNMLMKIGSIWVETEQMTTAFQNMGLKKTYLFPNCRSGEGTRQPRIREKDEKLKLVFFSRICKEKGVDIIMRAFEILNNIKIPITLDFYGELAAEIADRFTEFCRRVNSVRYHGVFDSVKNNVNEELNQYDIMLLPTQWEGEGVSGALIEAKMAGITAIVSDWHVNSEVVRDGQEGIVLPSLTAEILAETVIELYKDPKRLEILKHGAYASRSRYCIESYRQELIERAFG